MLSRPQLVVVGVEYGHLTWHRMGSISWIMAGRWVGYLLNIVRRSDNVARCRPPKSTPPALPLLVGSKSSALIRWVGKVG